MNWYIEVLKKYAVFEGRARRTEYWMFALFNLIISIVLGVIDGAAGSSGALSGVYALAVLLPAIGVSIRRLHDVDRTGWWLLIVLIPLIGLLLLLVFTVQDSTPGENRYGPNPKESAA